jgi:hypothetical protein
MLVCLGGSRLGGGCPSGKRSKKDQKKDTMWFLLSSVQEYLFLEERFCVTYLGISFYFKEHILSDKQVSPHVNIGFKWIQLFFECIFTSLFCTIITFTKYQT